MNPDCACDNKCHDCPNSEKVVGATITPSAVVEVKELKPAHDSVVKTESITSNWKHPYTVRVY